MAFFIPDFEYRPRPSDVQKIIVQINDTKNNREVITIIAVKTETPIVTP